MKTALTYNGEDFTWLKSRQNPLKMGRYSFLSLVAIPNFELQYTFIPHSAHNTYTKNEIQLKPNSFSQRAHDLTRRIGYLLRLVSKLPRQVIPKTFFADLVEKSQRHKISPLNALPLKFRV